jgi:23S rRNA (uracil1939-C5)-methyltransferase
MKQLFHIEKLVFGGLGLARTDQGVIFVRDVLPGEKVSAVLEVNQGGQKCAKPVSIEEPSPHRRKPPCAHFGICGGCDWLFGDYEVQLSCKKEIFIECLKRIGKIFSPPDCEVFTSPEFGYRRRVQFKVNSKENGIGFFKRKSQQVVPIRFCPLLQSSLNSLLATPGEIIRLLPSEIDQVKCIAGQKNCIASSPVLKNRTASVTEIQVGNHSFLIPGDGFFQSNAYLCEKLGAWAKGAIGGNFFVDLYGGVGYLAIELHECFKKGIIIDTIESQIVFARKNLINNSIDHITAKTLSAENFLLECSASGTAIDCIILDPPRPGLSKMVCESIVRCLPPFLLYISCNPSTQARDLGYFIRQGGYTIDKMALFDFYPNTHHMETAVLLKRSAQQTVLESPPSTTIA